MRRVQDPVGDVDLARAGAVIYPPVPALYGRPRTMAEMVDHTVGRLLHRLGVNTGGYHRWEGI